MSQALKTWFECDECEGGELQTVTRYGGAIVPDLVTALNGGLSAKSREELRKLLGARYDELEEQGRKDLKFKMKSTKEQFTSRYVGGIDAQYRIRASQALALIGGADARAALEAALAEAKRADVKQAIQRSLGQIR